MSECKPGRKKITPQRRKKKKKKKKNHIHICFQTSVTWAPHLSHCPLSCTTTSPRPSLMVASTRWSPPQNSPHVFSSTSATIPDCTTAAKRISTPPFKHAHPIITAIACVCVYTESSEGSYLGTDNSSFADPVCAGGWQKAEVEAGGGRFVDLFVAVQAEETLALDLRLHVGTWRGVGGGGWGVGM